MIFVVDNDWKFVVDHFKLLPDKPGSSKMVLVAVLDAPELVKAHEEYISKGCTHDFPEYIPHVTISYEVPSSFDLTTLTQFTGFLIPSYFYVEPLDMNWNNT
jgi:hypothetical protein